MTTNLRADQPSVQPSARERRTGGATREKEVAHRDHEYDRHLLVLLQAMQERHFWYRGRSRFLLDAVHRTLGRARAEAGRYQAVDLGGGCGGWLAYLLRRKRFAVGDVALADSSATALSMAASCVPVDVERHQIDLMDLPWSRRWDLAFLLDVLEHLPDQEAVLAQIRAALVPGGLLFVTVPALRSFWTWNDDVCRHLRRYCRRDFARLADHCGYELLDARYFMFILSPLLLGSRLAMAGSIRSKTEEQRRDLAVRMHSIPHPIVNGCLTAAFAAETPLGHFVRFPWGTSLLAVLRRPAEERPGGFSAHFRLPHAAPAA
jgi:SAM-dependent methyltransferase